MNFKDFSISFAETQYAGSCKITLTEYSDWVDVSVLQPAILTHGSDEFHFVVVSKSRTESHSEEEFLVELRSKAVLLDFPYAKEVSSNLSGTMSNICEQLAQLEGQSVIWEIPVDDILTVDQVQTKGKSPLESILEIVNTIGGIIQSHPDGSIHAQPEYIYNTNSYQDTVPSAVLSSLDDIISISEDLDKRDGYNKFEVSDVSVDPGYRLEAEEISPKQYTVKAYKVPWSGVSVALATSELTNVSIIPLSNPVVEVVSEDIEIQGGSGIVSLPCYGSVTWDYKTSLDLGEVTISEDGTVSTSVKDYSLVTVSYNTKFWQWDVYDTDIEDVQLILEEL